MISKRANPINETDAAARDMANGLLQDARTAALAFIHPETQAPAISRIAFSLTPTRQGLALISELSLHTRALRLNPRAALLLGDPTPRGDPLNQPRLSINAQATFPDKSETADLGLREFWLSQHPKSKLYVDFSDFCFVTFDVCSANLNGGFAKAYALDQNDLKVISK